MRKKIVMICLISIMSALLFGCTPPTETQLVVDIPEALTPVNAEKPTEQTSETTVPEVVPTETPVEVTIPEEVTAVNLVLGAYNKMRSVDRVKAVSKRIGANGEDEVTLIWDNKTGEVYYLEKGNRNTQVDKDVNDALEYVQAIPYDMEKYIVLENGCYVIYHVNTWFGDEQTIEPELIKERGHHFCTSDFTELFAGTLNLQLSPDTVMINDEPHYYLMYDRTLDSESWDMYIRCSDGVLTRMEMIADGESYVIDFSVAEEPIVVPEDVKQKASGVVIDYSGPDEIMVCLPELGHNLLSDFPSTKIGDTVITIGEPASFLTDSELEWASDDYFLGDEFVHDDGGPLQPGMRAQYIVECPNDCELIVLLKNDTDTDLAPEKCTVVGLMYYVDFEELVGRGLTLLDAAASLGDKYEILVSSYGGNVVKWQLEESIAYIASSYDEINLIFVIRPDMTYLMDALLE